MLLFRILCVVLILFFNSVNSLNNGLARTPQMGYNSWYDLQGEITEKNIRDTIDALVSTGLLEAGYNYINLDDDWAIRDADGKIAADPKKWSNGSLKAIADYAHSKKLYFGTYTDRGNLTCGGRPGAEGHEIEDAKVYASWGVDYLKEDSCHASQDHATAFEQYGLMRDALNRTGRKILFSLCGWNPWYAPVGASLGNSWRIGPDDTNWEGVLRNIDINSQLSKFAGPGGWNDPCLLLSDTWQMQQRITERQSRSQFSMWAVMASPLLISGNIRNMSDFLLETYLNPEVIAISQDSLGLQGTRIVGGDLTSTSNNPIAHTASCKKDISKPQEWMVVSNTSSKENEYILNQATGLALNADDCSENLIYYQPWTGKTCVGPSGKDDDNLRFILNSPSAGMITSRMNGQCVTESVDLGAQLKLTPCNTSNALQKWRITNIESALQFQNAATERCLDGDHNAAHKANIWMRKLSDGGVAIVFLNNDENDVDIPCDAECFSAMGFHPGQKLKVRDLWSRSWLNDITVPSSDGVPFIPSNINTSHGGCVMLKVKIK